MPRRNSEHRLRSSALAITVMTAALLGAAGQPSGATTGRHHASDGVSQAAMDGPLRLASFTPWVEPDGIWRVRFDTTGLAAGSTLSYSIRRPLQGDTDGIIGELRDQWAGRPLPAALLSTVVLPTDGLLDNGQLVLSVPVRAVADGSDRAFLPNPGIHPVAITVADPQGTTVQRMVLDLVRTPARPASPLRVAVVASSTTGPVVTTGRGIALSDRDRSDAERLADIAKAGRSLPLTLAPTPSLLDALALDGRSNDAATLAALAGAATDAQVVRSPWTPLHLEGWARDGEPADLGWSLVAGQWSLTERLGVTPDGHAWITDRTAGPASIGALANLGVDRILVRDGDLTSPAPSASTIFTVSGSRSTALTALSEAPDIAAALADTATDPTTAASRALMLVAARGLGDTNARQSMAILLDETVPRTAATSLVNALADSTGSDFVRSVHLDDAFENTDRAMTGPRRRRQPATRTLREPRIPTGIASLSTRLATLRTRVTGRDQMITDDRSAVPLDALLLTAQDRTLSPDARLRFVRAVERQVDTDLNAVVAPRSRTYTVTARTATLPLQFTNRTDHTVRVLVRYRSPRLSFERGARQSLSLRPGINVVNVDVKVRTSGQFDLRITTATPDGSIVLSRSSVRIRSTAFSGVGIVLSAGALLFLLGWWARTLKRERRAERQPDEAIHDHAESGGNVTHRG